MLFKQWSTGWCTQLNKEVLTQCSCHNSDEIISTQKHNTSLCSFTSSFYFVEELFKEMYINYVVMSQDLKFLPVYKKLQQQIRWNLIVH